MVEIEVLVYFKSSASGEARGESTWWSKTTFREDASWPPNTHTPLCLAKGMQISCQVGVLRPFHPISPLLCTEAWGKLFKLAFLVDLPL